jgi:hypothetical protein
MKHSVARPLPALELLPTPLPLPALVRLPTSTQEHERRTAQDLGPLNGLTGIDRKLTCKEGPWWRSSTSRRRSRGRTLPYGRLRLSHRAAKITWHSTCTCGVCNPRKHINIRTATTHFYFLRLPLLVPHHRPAKSLNTHQQPRAHRTEALQQFQQ